jgi:AcrR family transcriptional regulator
VTDTKDRREQLRDQRRRQILSAALEVFSQQGFYSSKVSDVAARAGVSQGTIYWYFASKEDLLTAALLSLFEDFGQEMLGELGQCETASEKLSALGRLTEGMLDQFEGAFTLFLEYWASSPHREETAQLWIQVLGEFKDVVVGIVEEGVESGEFNPMHADSFAWAFMAALDGLAAYAMLMPNIDLSEAVQVLIDTLLHGLLAHTS